jgi:hypothetical protein
MQMVPVDQWARADAQKITAGANVGFPLEGYQISLQWTRFALEQMQTTELATQFIAAQDADVKNLQLQLKTAIFTPTNSTYIDKFVNGLLLPVKAFLNADGQPIPLGPNGEIFNAGTHTHYLGVSSAGAPTNAEVKALIEHVIEHYAAGQMILNINRQEETKVRAFADFNPFYDNRLTVATTVTRGTANLDPIALYNRPIGIMDGAVVWVKPWVPAGYMFAHLNGAPKPLVMRERMTGSGGLRLMAENENFPLRASTMAREFGVGVWSRPNGAVLDTVTGSSTYTIPTITVT